MCTHKTFKMLYMSAADTDSEVNQACAKCLGEIGAVDPAVVSVRMNREPGKDLKTPAP